MAIIIVGGKEEKKMGQLNLPFAETTFGKNYSKKKKEEISRRVSNLLSDYTSKEILLPSEDIDKLENMRKKGLRITSKNIFFLLSVDLTDDEIGRLVKLQRSGIFPKTREEIFQLSSSVSESEKNIMLERGQIYNSLKEDGYDWWLSNMDYLLNMYPWWKIKGLYFYTKIDSNYHNCVSSMDDFVYLLGSDESKPHVKEKDILLCSEITMDEWNEIKPLFELFQIYLPKKGNGNNKDFFSKLASLSGKDVRKLVNIGKYINNMGKTEDQIRRKTNNDRRITLSILDFYGLLSLTPEQLGVVDQLMKELSPRMNTRLGLLLKLATLSEDDIIKLGHCKDLGLKIDEDNIPLLLSGKLNNDKIKALVKLQKYFEYRGSNYEIGSYLSEKFILKVIESDEFCEFINSLDYGEDGFADRWFSRDISILLERDFDVVSIKRLYYYFKIRSYDTNAPLDFREYLYLDELINEYNDSPINPGVIEFVYKKGLYKSGKQQGAKDNYDDNEELKSFSLFNEIPVRALEFVQKNVESVERESLHDLLNVFQEFKKSSENNYDNKVSIVITIVQKCLSGREKLSMNVVVAMFKFIFMNIDNVDLLLKRMELGEIAVDDLLKACDIIYPGNKFKTFRSNNLPPEFDNYLPF